MKIFYDYESLKPTTSYGYGVKLNITYTSYDESEIAEIIKTFQNHIGSGLVVDAVSNHESKE